MPTRIATALPYTELEVADGNYDTSRAPIDRIIIHTMVGTWQGAASRFDAYGTQVSAHYGVKLDGSLIHWLEETFTAYHAGSYTMNQRSIGIEHEDGGDYNGVRPDVLYTESAKLVRDICTFYGIPIDRQHILKHSEVIPTGCPDALDIDRIVREAAATDPQVTIDQLRKERDDNWNLYQTALTLLKECQNKVVSPPVEIPITVTTSGGSSSSPVVPVSTDGTTSANPTGTTENLPISTQSSSLPDPIKPPMTMGSHIVWLLTSIKNALKKLLHL